MGKIGHVESDGSGSYSIEEASDQQRGTKIVIKLKDDFSEFAKEDRVKDIIKKYSAFVQFPVSVNGEKGKTPLMPFGFGPK